MGLNLEGVDWNEAASYLRLLKQGSELDMEPLLYTTCSLSPKSSRVASTE